MAEVRCPMCGKPNTDDLEACQFCEARLKPLIINQPGDQPASSQGDLSDWLSSFQAGQSEQSQPAEDRSTGEPDWLSGMRMDYHSSDVPDDEMSSAEQGDSDWLTRLGISESQSESTELPAATSGSLSDWLSDLRTEDQRLPPDMSGDDIPESEIPEWLASPVTSSVEESQELPEWLSGAEMTPQTPDRQASEAEAAPAGDFDTELPDWLSEPAAETPAEAASQTPDRQASEAEAAPTGDFDAELPDWLSEPAAETPAEGASQTPEWQASEREAAPAGDFRAELPDWLSEIGAEPDEKAPQTPDWQASEAEITLEGEFAGELPEWFEETKTEAAQSRPQASDLQADELDQDMKEWLAGLEETVDEDLPPIITGEESPVSQILSAEEPDWLRELEETFSEMPVTETPPPAPAGPFAFSDLGEGESDLPADLPDWFSSSESLDAGSQTEEPEIGLSPADLPGWLEAMRPMAAGEIFAGQESDAPAEGAGPLAGLQGVLPAEPDIAYSRKPPVYSIKLHAPELQKAHAELLHHLVETENEASPIPGRPVIAPQHILRILIALALILSILAPLISSSVQMALPKMTVDSFVGEYNARQVVDSLPSGRPVLVVVDYQPGFSAEMQSAAGAVIDHLMIKGAFLTLVSTTPTGPIQAENLVQHVNQISNHQYRSPMHYTNLGFIPGGLAGILSFVHNPRQTLPSTMDGELAWDLPNLQAVTTIANFAMVMVVTENPELGRAWIEQTHTGLHGIPLLMVTSAQAEPLIRPYFQSNPRQVAGMVSGIAGAVAYESSFGRRGSASQSWSAFSIGLLVASLLIVLGGAVNGTSLLVGRSKDDSGSEG
jgi:hypothetical protein